MARPFPTSGPSTQGLLLAAIVSAVVSTSACGSRPAEEAEAVAAVPTITADVATVARRTLDESLTIRGSITTLPNQDVKVSALVPGRVDTLTVAEGDAVREGQVIASLDGRALEDQRRQSAAGVQQATVRLENARLELQRSDRLFARGIAAGKEVEDAKTAVAEAQAALEQASASLNTATLQLDRIHVRAPIGGLVVKRMVSVGEQVDGTAAQPIVEIANLDRMELAASVPAAQLPSLRIGQHVTVASDAYVGRAFEGTIVAIAPAMDQATNTALVRIRLVNIDRMLKVGMFAHARVRLAEHTNALVVPPSALVRNDDGAAVYVVLAGTATRTTVTTGLEMPEAVEILSGLTEGQTILTTSVYGLGDSAHLTPKP